MTSFNRRKTKPSHEQLDINCKQDVMEFCLICCSQVQVSLDNIQKERNQISKNLAVIFLLKNVFQLPDSQLERNLKEVGDPVNWISLCENCSELTSKALNFHCQIVKLDRELWSTQQLIVDKMTSISTLSLATAIAQKSENSTRTQEIWMRTRGFMKNANLYIGRSIPKNPFIQGDKLALKYHHEKLAARENVTDFENDNPSSPKLKVEVEDDILFDDEVDDDDDMEWSETSEEDMKPQVDNDKVVKRIICAKKRVVINGRMKCNYCDKEFFNKLACFKHEQEEHSTQSPGQIICEICGRIFDAQTNLRNHKYQVHRLNADGTPVLSREPDRQGGDGDDEFIPPTCKTCLKTFSTPKTLANHVKIIHEKKLLYSCQLCGKEFRNSAKVNMHMLRIHKEDPLTKQLEEEGIRIWKCTQKGCSADFLHESSLKAHCKKGHDSNYNRVRICICDVCGKNYRDKKSYLEHKKLIHNMVEKKERGEGICAVRNRRHSKNATTTTTEKAKEN